MPGRVFNLLGPQDLQLPRLRPEKISTFTPRALRCSDYPDYSDTPREKLYWWYGLYVKFRMNGFR